MLVRTLLRRLGAALALALPAAAADLMLYHYWSNESEMAALNVIVDAFEAKGNTVTDLVRAARDRRASPLVSLFVAGTPPNVFIQADAGFYRDLKAQGQSREPRTTLRLDRRHRTLPRDGAAAITVDGEIRRSRPACTSTAWSTTT